MTKKQLLQAIRQEGNYKVEEAKKALEVVLGVITEALAKGEKVTISGFGTFSVRTRKARTAVKPGTRERIEVPARKTVAFKPSKELKERI